MKSKNKSALLIALLLIFTLGCTIELKKTSKDTTNIRVGFNGLVLEFLKNTPPLKVFENDKFPVIVKVRNNGAYSIGILNQEKIFLSLGVEKDYNKPAKLRESGRVKKVSTENKVLDNAAEFNLEGRSNINLRGDEEVVVYEVQADKIDPQSEIHPSTVVATLCYPYETQLDTTVCIDSDVSNLRPGKKACTVQDLVFSNGQGAPVAITKVEVSMLPAEFNEQGQEYRNIKPQFLLFIENRGKGTVIKNDVVKEFCIKSDTNHENINKVQVKAFLSKQQLDCRKDKQKEVIENTFVKLKDNKELVRCTLEQGIEGSFDAYLAPLNVVLNYGYTDSVSANYVIQKVSVK